MNSASAKTNKPNKAKKRKSALVKRKRSVQEQVYCICRSSDESRPMVQCEQCKEWFHFDCVGLNPMQQMDIDEKPFYC